MANMELPSRLFADREEPVGDRVNPYFKLNSVRVVLKALQPSEVERIRPVFGKILDLYSKPVFSGKLAHFLLTRQLDVVKRHETWVVFAGKPFRFSLREFGLVTGLNCDPLPPLPPHLVECPPGVTPYWFTLFGGKESVTGETLLAKLRKPKSLTPEQRLKYACLVLVDGLLARRSFHMKIPKVHVEMIRELDDFLKYPWGRYSFDMTMQSIKSRSLNQLAQATVAIQGFIHALLLVFVESVPSVLADVGDGTDPESGDEEVDTVISLKLDKVWELDGEDKVDVLSIIPSEEVAGGVGDCTWVDEVLDPKVELLLGKIEEGVMFKREMFVGGFRGLSTNGNTPSRVQKKIKRKAKVRHGKEPMSEAGSANAKKLKVRRPREPVSDPNAKLLSSISSQIQAGLKEGHSIVYASVAVDVKEMESRLAQSIKTNIASAISDFFRTRELVDKVMEDVGEEIGLSGTQIPDININPFPQHIQSTNDDSHDAGKEEGENSGERHLNQPSASQQTLEDVVLPTVLGGARRIDDSVSRSQVWSPMFAKLSCKLEPTMPVDFSNGLLLTGSHLLNLPVIIPPDFPQVMDSCVSVIRESIFNNMDPASDPKADILPCKFVGSLAVLYSNFKKCKKRDCFEFGEDLVASVTDRFKLNGREWLTHIDYLYSPFNIDKNRWIGLMIDLPTHSLTVFDATANVVRGPRFKSELEFICDIFPYLVRQIGFNEAMKSYPLHPLSLIRDTKVAQASLRSNTGILSLLLMEAHAFGGNEKLYNVTEADCSARAQQLAVEMYVHCFGELD